MVGTRLLVMSDDEALRRLICLNLRARGSEVEEECLNRSLLSRNGPTVDAAIVDLGPDGIEADGWELVRALRATGWARSLPLVVLGASWSSPAQVVLLKPLIFVRKPFAIGTLLDALRAAVESHPASVSDQPS